MMCDYTALCSTRLAVLGSELVEQSSLYLNKFHTGNTSAIYNDGDFDCKPKKGGWHHEHITMAKSTIAILINRLIILILNNMYAYYSISRPRSTKLAPLLPNVHKLHYSTKLIRIQYITA